MPKLLTTSSKTFDHYLGHPSNLATTKMGHRPHRPFTTFERGNKFAVVAVEYFTRWIEAKPLATITSETVKNSFGKT
jgi:hypothetical protein